MAKTLSMSEIYFRHADKLTIDPVRGVQTGKIPEWLEGVLIRNGPGIQEFGPDRYDHYFDGIAVLHRFEIKNGDVTYQSRQLDCDTYKKNREHQRIVVSEFGTFGVTDPCKSLLERFKATFFPLTNTERSDNCNVNVAFYGDQLYTMTERTFVRRIDPVTLKTVGEKTNLRNHLTVNHATAHPHILEDGTVLNMGNNFLHAQGPHYCIISVPPSYDSDETSFKGAKVLAEIPCRWKMYPCYYHSFGMTTDKIIFIEQPYGINVKKMMIGGLFAYPTRDCISWHDGYKTRFYITPKDTGKTEPLIYETDNLFTFHHINAYEEDGNLIVDVAAYDNAKFVNDINVKTKSEGLKGASARRYILPLSVKDAKPGVNLINIKNCKATAKLREGGDGNVIDVTPHILSNRFFEFPRINYKRNGQSYNYFYGCETSPAQEGKSTFPHPHILSKFDIKANRMLRWEGKGVIASEPIFIPNPTIQNPAEDDGVLVSALLHENDQTATTLLILDAKNMMELARVKFATAGPVTTTFHGIFAQKGNKVHLY
jgi:carotenoid cleavage dioxygenase-like enzyme